MPSQIKAIYIAANAGDPMIEVESAHLEVGRGIVGDRYYAHAGTFSEKLAGKPGIEVTLIEAEEIDRFNAKGGFAFDYGDFRRCVVTTGVRLNDLVGKQFSVGETLLEGVRLCEPCAHLAELTTSAVLPGLVGRAGLRANIIVGGIIAPQDLVEENAA